MSDLPSFLALIIDSADSFESDLLTPSVMRWSDRCWLMDLSQSQNYWRMVAKGRGLDTIQLFQNILNHVFEPKGLRYSAALAPDPWRAVLLATSLDERKLNGLVNISQPIGQSLFQQLSWDSWFLTSEELGKKLTCLKWPRFNEGVFLRQQKLLRASVGRLNLARPIKLSQAESSAIRRRFGSTLAMLWDWTYLVRQEAYNFPWISWHKETKPQITANIDYPLWTWANIEPLLKEDLDKLCKNQNWHSGEKVSLINWNLMLGDLSHLEIKIRFRNPHEFHREIGSHKTTLIQANYSFQDAYSKNKALQDPDFFQPIIGWTITIEEKMCIPKRLMGLFSEMMVEEEIEKILELENQLPVDLYQYDMHNEWLPENSFGICSSKPHKKVMEDIETPWLLIAKNRPIFLYDKPRPLEPSLDKIQSKRFLERVATTWWQESSVCDQRDYYRLTDSTKHLEWSYRDASGQWFSHGLFA